ncbi:serine protease snake-like [Anoplophora glabripennis]|uniref:serine protease snake-like n=1 Tax=Anoplophora glabripennis TaxID=217634 RepID=UPI0008738775|nr:serine protease snake-like [Anoplophora glabripennis]
MSTRFGNRALLFAFIVPSVSFATLYKGDKCSLQDGSEGKCKLINDCPAAVQLLRTKIHPKICGFERNDSIVCCEDGEDVTETTGTVKTNSRTAGDISKQKCEKYAEYAYEKIQSPTLLLNPHITKRLVCDIPRNRLVVGSSLASRREFPHMAVIGYNQDGEVKWSCAGSLISENFVLTTAHCLFIEFLGPAKMVRVGLTNKTDLTHIQERTVSEIVPYPEYNKTKYHDIGLLRLSKNIKFNSYVRPACLQTEKYIPFVLAISSGWGALVWGKPSNDLLAIVLEFYSADKCNYTYRRAIRPGGDLENGIVDDLMICAGTSKAVNSTCRGESGGPLQVYHKETEEMKCMYDIIGVTSFGFPPCSLQNDVPDVYVRVSAYLKWIEDTVWPE